MDLISSAVKYETENCRGDVLKEEMFLVGNAAFRRRFPKVSYRTEVPFMIGGAITFGLITWLHYSSYSKLEIGQADPFVTAPKKKEPQSESTLQVEENTVES